MTDAAIIVRNVSKKYRLFNSPKDRLKEALHPFSKRYHREFWALRDVSLEVPRGHTIGILGRNGSGKSTLLQIIAGILKPTSGDVVINGRVSALLELGAGFNPEFTGRENVIFQAELTGLSAKEIEKRLPEIEAYADIGEFFDQPVKTYSSGMFVRVAFASATNIDPDILIVDEALAVGDARFQHKCFGTLRSFVEAGKTLLLVSHDVATLLRICDAGLVLENGQMHTIGPISAATNAYQSLLFGSPPDFAELHSAAAASEGAIRDNLPEAAAETPMELQPPIADLQIPIHREGSEDRCATKTTYNKNETRIGNGLVRIQDFAIVVEGQVDPAVIPLHAMVSVYAKLCFFGDLDNVSFGCGIAAKDGVLVQGTNLFMQRQPLLRGRKGQAIVMRFTFRQILVGGDYFLNLGCNHITDQQDTYLDIRRSVAHLRFADTRWCAGFAAFESSFALVERIDPERSLSIRTSDEPQLLETIGKCNVVEFHSVYYGIPQSLGRIDFKTSNPRELPGVLRASTHDELRASILKLNDDA